MPAAHAAKTYPAHDDHAREAAAVGLDAYDSEDKARIFSVHFREIGMLPILLVVTNDGDQPISLADMKAELVTADRTKLVAAVPDDIYRRLSHPSTGSNYPLPFPTKKVKGGISNQTRDEVEGAQFAAQAVEPHTSQAGFIFFDVSGLSDPLAGARFYLTGVRNSNGDELMYFEVPLERSAGAASDP
jgi:hypothetical protein